ncbi:tyrosine-type recombinase/integrase [Mariniblastus sp.]|nr:tyrosine-type recombinase/integrase [Mariniblastus sp.]
MKIRSKYLVLRWECPTTGKPKQKSAKTNDRRKAERLAAKLEQELLTGTYFEPCKITWKEFRDLFEELRIPNLRPATAVCYDSTFNRLEKLINPRRLSQVNSMLVARFQNKLRDVGNADTTVAKHLRHLKAALRWAKTMDFIATVPDFHFPKSGKHQRMMKGRPIDDAEFQRMLDAVNVVVGDDSAESWRFLLRGIWWSGLRLGEALALTWQPSKALHVDFDSGKYPMFRIQAEAEKGGQDRLLPMTPEFAKLIEPHRQEAGFVFNPERVHNGRKSNHRRNTEWVSIIGSRIGEKSEVAVVSNGSKTKYASFHDLRRSFGERWSSRVMPQTLMKLMRHESIETTLRFYVGHDAEKIAEEIWNSIQ